MRVQYPKLRNMPHTTSLCMFIASKGSSFYIIFAITAVGVVVALKVSPNIIYGADYIIYFGPLRSVRIFRVIKIVQIIRIESSSKRCLNYFTPFRCVYLI